MKTAGHGNKPEYRLLIAGGEFMRCRDYDAYMTAYAQLRLLGLGTRYVREEYDRSAAKCRYYFSIVRDGAM